MFLEYFRYKFFILFKGRKKTSIQLGIKGKLLLSKLSWEVKLKKENSYEWKKIKLFTIN